MASNIIAPQPLPTSTTLTEDLIKMFTQPATLSELVEKEPSLKRHFQQVFSPNEPPGKRAAPAFQLPPQMQNNLSLTQQQQQLLQHQVMQQALSRGQATLPANFQLPGNLLPSLGAVPHIDIDKIRKEQLQQQQQQLHQQQIQQAQQLQQQQMQQQQQQQHQQHQQQQLAQIQQQQQIYQQQQLQLLQQHQRAVQQQQQQQQSLQQIQQIPAGQAAVRGGMIDLRQAQQASNYDLNLLMRYQQAQLAQTSAAQSAQAQAMQSQMPPRRQTISTATLPQSVSSLNSRSVGEVKYMANAIPRLHRPSPQLMPNTSPILSTSAPVGPAAVPTPKIQNFIQPIVPTRSPVALTPLNPTATKGPDDPEFIRFLLLTRQNEHNLHSMMGDSMIRLPGTSSKE